MTLLSTNSSESQTPKSEKLRQAFELLQQCGYEDTYRLGIVSSGVEQFFGAVYNKGDVYSHNRFSAGSIIDDAVLVKLPKRIMRSQFRNSEGKVGVELGFSDVDFIDEGTIEVKPQYGFFLRWLDEESQFRYCQAVLGFLEGKKIAKAQAAGIVLPDGPLTPPPGHRR